MSMRMRLGVWLVAAGLASSSVWGSAFELEKQFPLPGGGELVVRTEAGGVEVRGGAGEVATVTVTSDRSDFAEKFDVRFDDSQPGRLEVIVERKGAGPLRWWSWSGETRVEVTVPVKTSAEVRSSGGGVVVTGLEGAVTAKSSGGSVRVAEIVGDVVVSSSGGGVEVSDIRGAARLDSSGGSAVASRVSGDIDAGSSGGGVKIEEAGGYVVASSSGGGVRVGFAAGNAKGGDIGSSGGGVRVRIDPSVGLEIDASSSGGNVHCDLAVRVRGRISKASLRGELGDGGARLKLRSSGGGVTLEAR